MTPYYEHNGVTIYHADCREVIPKCVGVNLVVTDPPYSFGMASSVHEKKSGSWGDMMNAASFYADVLSQIHDILRQGGGLWMFNSWRSLPILTRAAYEASWPIVSLLVWDKQWIGPGGDTGLRPSYELVALFSAHGWKLPNRGLPDIWPCQWSSHKPHHPAEKPVELLGRMIVESGGTVILDPFCGSGSTLVAAKLLGHNAIGVETEERHCETAAKRLSQQVFDFAG